MLPKVNRYWPSWANETRGIKTDGPEATAHNSWTRPMAANPSCIEMEFWRTTTACWSSIPRNRTFSTSWGRTWIFLYLKRRKCNSSTSNKRGAVSFPLGRKILQENHWATRSKIEALFHPGSQYDTQFQKDSAHNCVLILTFFYFASPPEISSSPCLGTELILEVRSDRQLPD